MSRKELTERIKVKVYAAKIVTERKIVNTANWCIENKELVSTVAPMLIGGAIAVGKMLQKEHKISEERYLKDNYIYDQRRRHYYELRRKPKTSEWIRIDQALDEGVPLYAILDDMRLLKR